MKACGGLVLVVLTRLKCCELILYITPSKVYHGLHIIDATSTDKRETNISNGPFTLNVNVFVCVWARFNVDRTC